jgi:hypothetical protein
VNDPGCEGEHGRDEELDHIQSLLRMTPTRPTRAMSVMMVSIKEGAEAPLPIRRR